MRIHAINNFPREDRNMTVKWKGHCSRMLQTLMVDPQSFDLVPAGLLGDSRDMTWHFAIICFYLFIYKNNIL